MTINTNLTATLIGMVAAVGLLFNIKKNTKEGFAGMTHPMGYKINRETHLQCRSDQGGCDGSSDFYSVSGNYQASLAPRFSNVDYGAHLRYNMPDMDNQAVPPHPLGSRGMVDKCLSVENYAPVCDYNRVEVRDSSLREKRCDVSSNQCGGGEVRGLNSPSEVQHMLPVTDMRTVSCTAGMQTPANQNAMMKNQMSRGMSETSCKLGDQQRAGDCNMQPVVYDRFIYANSRSRLKQGSDWIRGDIPIVPILPEANPNSPVWMRPSVTPHIDLNPGAMNVMGGYDNTTNNQLRSLMQASTDGTLSTFGGAAIPQNYSSVCGPQQDIIVSSFA